jgi:hypothetical protein
METVEISVKREGQTVLTERREDGNTRELIDFLLYVTNEEYIRRYWINVLVKQGRLSEGRAGQLLVNMGLI